MKTNPVCEVRVITHKRPVWLKRALDSLLAQTCRSWVAYVHDDSPQREGEAVVRDLRDSRLQYCPNEVNLGAAANLDQGFSGVSRSGARYACILEDDNWFLPEFLQENASLLDESDVNLLMRNQWISEQRDFSANGDLTSRTTLEPWYSEGLLQPFELRARMLLMQGVSNGGLFWRLDGRNRLQVGPLVKDSGVQEFCRAWQIDEPMCVAMRPLAVWSRTYVGTQHYTKAMIRSSTRGFQALRKELFREHGLEMAEKALSLVPDSCLRSCSHGLAMAVPPTPGLLRRLGSVYLRDWFFSCLRARWVANPLDAYLQSRLPINR